MGTPCWSCQSNLLRNINPQHIISQQTSSDGLVQHMTPRFWLLVEMPETPF